MEAETEHDGCHSQGWPHQKNYFTTTTTTKIIRSWNNYVYYVQHQPHPAASRHKTVKVRPVVALCLIILQVFYWFVFLFLSWFTSVPIQRLDFLPKPLQKAEECGRTVFQTTTVHMNISLGARNTSHQTPCWSQPWTSFTILHRLNQVSFFIFYWPIIIVYMCNTVPWTSGVPQGSDLWLPLCSNFVALLMAVKASLVISLHTVGNSVDCVQETEPTQLQRDL